MVKLTFFGGVNEIGGNKILLEDSGTKIFLDFGMSFSRYGMFFSEFLQPRKYNGLGDFFEFGLLPDLKGLYRLDYIKHMGRKEEEKEIDAVFLSHAHADHSAFIHHLREDIPIYCSKPTYCILKALNDTSSGVFNEFTEIKESFQIYINKKGVLGRKNSRNNPEIKKDRLYRLFEFGKKFKVDGVEVLPFNVDHSLPGATGFIIYTSSGIIVYTGDFRFHGRRGEKTVEFMEACSREKPDVLIIEGTRIEEKENKKEEDVEIGVANYASENGLTVCNWPVRDIDRMMSFYKAAEKTGKRLVINFKQFYLLNLLKDCDDVEIPNIKEVEKFATRKGWGLIGKDYEKKLILEDYEKWEREFLDESICYKDLMEMQEEYLFFCSNFDLKDLIDIKPKLGSVYIKSVCEPFDPETEIDWKRIKNWIDHFSLDLHKIHASGHASGPDLRMFIENVKPKISIPIHTEMAKLYKKILGEDVKILNQGDTFEVS